MSADDFNGIPCGAPTTFPADTKRARELANTTMRGSDVGVLVQDMRDMLRSLADEVDVARGQFRYAAKALEHANDELALLRRVEEAAREHVQDLRTIGPLNKGLEDALTVLGEHRHKQEGK